MPRVLLLLILLLSPGLARAQEAVDQRDFKDSINGCGPATILNLLKFSSDPAISRLYGEILGGDDGTKMRFLVDRFFKSRNSVSYPGERRWGLHGIESSDLATGLNEMLAENDLAPLASTYLDRRKDETAAEHLTRCHQLIARSIESGVMPVLSLRSFVVKRRERMQMNPHWESGIHHYVLVVAVDEKPSSLGFELEVIDPWRGKRGVVYLHRETHGHPFTALKGTEDNGEWLSGRPFLKGIAEDLPSLRPADLDWSERFNIVANFLIGRF
jgi:hypothetical protein